ncbi:polygalacturonase precursor [Neurospora tetrasperma FGSC 2508]|uniref:endo-polygalacturonase n=1 Tax=Neurospora tetrasperma (strain FGSC 2508 / ATCC MYA-4615 / P0657) TaxID=510951 RepID=F8MUB1_NEUT8|nr:polygalacturonase precursor [Neurospora tetrasperma FGSC 2508]EGO55593.1 polygalacturonase precursor [Neurospora tetrasperma FGSC 2508]EGZ69164.1 polygalacturonase precursor [Neurospora tetrasperma FGSC 2509]
MAASIPSTSGNHIKASSSCTFSGSTGFDLLSKGLSSCQEIVISDLQVPAGKTLTLDKLNPGTTVTFAGNTTFPYLSSGWAGPLLSISSSSKLTIRGLSSSVLYGSGEKYWDGLGQKGPIKKPKFFQVHNLEDSVIEGVTILNAPVQVMSINGCKNLTVTGFTLDNKAGDGDWNAGKGGRNTDAFDIGSSSNVVIDGAKVYNQDDCVAINSGTDITFRNGLCSGGHGLSIGSVGGRSDNTVKNVLFENSVIANSENGARIKTNYGTTGLVSNITYRNVKLQNITKYGIMVDQSYGSSSKNASPTNGVPITGFTLSNVTGNVLSSGTNIFINCGDGSCKQFEWNQVDIKGGKKSSKCLRVPSGAWC